MILLIDNYDSFTYNIAQYFEQLGVAIVVKKNDALTLTDIESIAPSAIVLGPGPGTPDNAGITLACIEYFAGKLPLLGVCLGHQAIAQAFGGYVIPAQQVMHGRVSTVFHCQKGLFNNITNPTTVTRYHSLLVDKNRLPDTLEITAWTVRSEGHISEDGSIENNTSSGITLSTSLGHESPFEIMALCHKTLAIEGVQFHPESILSTSGKQIFNNFLLKHQLLQNA